MKSPRITLSIALLLSLPAKIYAADAGLPVGLPIQSADNTFSSDKNYKWHKGNAGNWDSREAAMSTEASQSFFATMARTEQNQTMMFAELGGEIEWRERTTPYTESSGTHANEDSPVEFYQEMFEQFDGVLLEQKAATLVSFKQDELSDSFNATTKYEWQPVEINGKITYVPLADGAALPTVAYYQQVLLAFPESDQLKDSMFTALARFVETSDKPIARKVTFKRKQSLRERREQLSAARSEALNLLLASGNHRWEAVEEEGKRTRYALRAKAPEQPAEPASSLWSYLPSMPSLFAAPKGQRLIDLANVDADDINVADVDAKNDAVNAIRSRGKTFSHNATWGKHQGLHVKAKEQAWERTQLIKHPETEKSSFALAPTAQRIHTYYEESELTDELLTSGLRSSELALFKQSTEDRALARKENSAEASKKLLSILAHRRNLLEGTSYTKDMPACDPGLNILTALEVKTAEQRTKVLAQLRATESVLAQELAAESLRATTALNIAQHRDLIARVDALTAAQKDWDITNEQGTTLALLPVKPFVESASKLYTEQSDNWKTWWQGSWNEPADAAALRIVTEAIPKTNAALADAREKGVGHLIDRYTTELAQHETDKARLVKAIQNEVVEQTRALLLTDATLLDAYTRVEQLQAPLTNINSVIKKEEKPRAQLASMIAILTADSREEGRATGDAIRALLRSSTSRIDLTRKKQNVKERTAFTVRAHDPSASFIEALVPAVDTAFEAANKPTYAQAAAGSSSETQPKPQPKSQPKKNTGKGKGKGHGPAKKPQRT